MRFTGILFLALLAAGAPSARADRAEAQRLVGEAFAAVKAGRESDGLRIADQAVHADPTCGEAYSARGIAHLWLKQSREAAEDLAYGIALGSALPQYRGYLAQALGDLKRWHEALEAADAAVQGLPAWDVGYHTRARARLELGMVNEAIADWTKALSIKEVGYQYMRARAWLAAGDYEKCVADCGKWAACDDPSDRCFALFTRCVACVLQEKYAEAQADADKMMKEMKTCFGGHVGMAYLHVLARDPKLYDPAKAMEYLAQLPPELHTVRTVNAQALVLAANENYVAALDELAFHQDHPDYEAAALRALCLWRLGDAEAARRALAQALRLDPYLPKLLEHHRVLAPLAALLPRARSAADADAGAGGRKELDLERTGYPVIAGLIESLARQYRFAAAEREYRAWLASLSSPLHKAEVADRIAVLGGLAAAHARLVRGINDKTWTDVKIVAGKVETTLTSAGEEGFEYTFAQGNGKGLWVAFRPAEMADLLLRGKPDPRTLFAVGIFGLDRGLDKSGAPLLKRALDADAGLKDEVDRALAARRGIEVPAGGFLFAQNVFLTPEEKRHVDQGEVFFRGEWMAKKDREQLAAGKTKAGGKWVPNDEKHLARLGFRKVTGKWLTPEEYRDYARVWAHALEATTPHYVVRTSLGAEFTAELAAAAEAAYAEMKRFFGGREPALPTGAKMTLLAFYDYGDYRDYCREIRAEDKLALRGFALADVPLAATYDLANDPGETLRSMIHEAARLWILKTFPQAHLPDWWMEGLAGLFEGFAWNGRAYDFDHAGPVQLALAKRAALADLLFPLDFLFRCTRAEALAQGPRDGALYEAESWALAYFLEQSPNPAHASLLGKLVEATASGGAVDLDAGLGDEKKTFEKEFRAFLRAR